jgi:hypothetical protein
MVPLPWIFLAGTEVMGSVGCRWLLCHSYIGVVEMGEVATV